jgi:thrombospondin type 3 repeat protein
MKKIINVFLFLTLLFIVAPQQTTANEDAYLRLISPNGGETYEAGDVMTIEWEHNDIVSFNIAHVRDNTTTLILSNQDMNDYPTNSYTWTIPEGLHYSEEYEILISGYYSGGSNENTRDRNDSYITMGDPKIYNAPPIMYYSYEIIPEELIEGDTNVHLFDFTLSASYKDVLITSGYILEETSLELEMIRLGFNFFNGGELRRLKLIDTSTGQQIGGTTNLITQLQSYKARYHFGIFEPETPIIFNNNTTKTFSVFADIFLHKGRYEASESTAIQIKWDGDGWAAQSLDFNSHPSNPPYGLNIGSLPTNTIPFIISDEPNLIDCTSWTYTDWSSCNNNQQTRSIISSSPNNCTDGNPILTQSCQVTPVLISEPEPTLISTPTLRPQDPERINKNLSNRVKGELLLAVEDGGRVFYVNPGDAKKYEVTFANALHLFERLAIGITNNDLNKISLSTDNAVNNFGKQHLGRLFLQVEDKGRIWYVDMDGKRHEVTWNNLMSLFTRLSLGITNNDLDQIENEEILDTDNDGLSDINEAIYGTDINNPDSDGDGYLDGEEVENGYDPMGAGRL